MTPQQAEDQSGYMEPDHGLEVSVTERGKARQVSCSLSPSCDSCRCDSCHCAGQMCSSSLLLLKEGPVSSLCT